MMKKLGGFLLFILFPAACLGIMVAMAFGHVAPGLIIMFGLIGFGLNIGQPRRERGER